MKRRGHQPSCSVRSSTSLAVLAGVLTVWLVFNAARTPTAAQGAPPAPFQLPAPTGPYPVGTTMWHVNDDSRKETFADVAQPREVEVVAWYPAAARTDGASAPYLRDGLAEVRAFATLLRAPETIFDQLAKVPTHARVDAALSTGAKLPLLLFSHGYTSVPSAYTALLEDLASHGYVVLSIIHPYESTASSLADGRVVSLLDEKGTLRQPIRDVFAEWAAEDQTMAAVTSTNGEAERLRLLRAYLAGLGHTREALGRWVDDTRLVLDRLATFPASTSAGKVAARIDVSRIGVFGHSMGGVTAGQFCVEDRRCRAALNLDGIPQYGNMVDRNFGRPFLMVYSARPGRRGASDAIYKRAASPYYRVDVSDTLHLDFSDMIFWGGPLRDRGILGRMAPARASEITRAIVREFFDQTLRGKPAPLLKGQQSFAEVNVRVMPERTHGAGKRN